MKRAFMLGWLILGLLVTARPVAAAESDLDRLLNLLVQHGTITKEEAAQLRAGASKDSNVTAHRPLLVSAFIQTRYHLERAANDPFDIRRARVDLRAEPADHLTYHLLADFAGASAKLLDATVGYEPCALAGLQAGQMKVPFSLENVTADTKLETINRSQVVEALVARSKDVVGNQNGRDTGLQVAGNLAKRRNIYLLEYALGVFNGAGVNAADTNEQKDLAARLIAHPTSSLAFGGSWYRGRYSAATGPEHQDTRNRVGAEAAYVSDPVSLKAEYIRGKDSTVKKEGWYAQACWFFVPRVLQGVGKIDAYDGRTSNGRTTVYTVGANWSPVKWFVLQTDYEKHKEEHHGTKNDILSWQATVQF